MTVAKAEGLSAAPARRFFDAKNVVEPVAPQPRLRGCQQSSLLHAAPIAGGMDDVQTRKAEDLVSRLRKHSVLREASANVVNAMPAGYPAAGKSLLEKNRILAVIERCKLVPHCHY